MPRRSTVVRIADQIEGLELEEDLTLLLEIESDDTDLRVRDLAAFLSLIDSAFGRLDEAGYLSYAHRPDDQLHITAVKGGSTKYEIAVLVLEYLHMWQTIVTFAVVTCLPSIISGRAAKNWAEAYRAAGEGRAIWKGGADEAQLSRRQKAVIREVLRSDPVLGSLSKNDSNRLARAVEHVLSMEHGQVNRAARFSREHVRSVALRIVEKA